MIQIFIIHNGEQDRLHYLLPRLNDLVDYMDRAGESVTLELVGPDSDLMREKQYSNTFVSKIRRATEASLVSFFYSFNKPTHPSLTKELAKRLRTFCQYLFGRQRLITIEQDLLYKHAYCWRKCSESRTPAIILESDAIINAFTQSSLLALLEYVTRPSADEWYYVDLAGGCDKRVILNSWCFEREHGCKNVTLQVEPEIKMHLLPRLTTNTTCAYLVSSPVASELFRSFVKKRPALTVDWAIMFLAVSSERLRSALCIHTTPTLFNHGSSLGNYPSGIDRLPN